jgi:hypothetical protein
MSRLLEKTGAVDVELPTSPASGFAILCSLFQREKEENAE